MLADFLKQHWQRLELDRFGSPAHLSCVLATPRFRASSHVLFLVLASGRDTPILVVKVPRLPDDNRPLTCEARNLRLVQSSRPEGFRSVPTVVAFETCAGRSMLVETGLDGSPLNLGTGEARLQIDRAIDWLIDLHEATRRPGATVDEWYQRTAIRPLERFVERVPDNHVERELVERTSTLASTLREGDLPLVFEHRDFAPPNILSLRSGGLGVVDWELADASGLPGSDLFYFLTVAAFSRDRARSENAYLTSFQRAFLGSSAWAQPYISRYARRVGLSHYLLVPLFILSWSRYVTALASRLHGFDDGRVLEPRTAAWLRSNRFYRLWKYAVTHHDRLNLG
jgi:aminoglycoside phosphotransferase (APT) family kinase protein